MQATTNIVPLWISALFFICISIPVFQIARAIKQGGLKASLDTNKVSQLFYGSILFYSLFFAYTALLSFSGAFQANTFPPRVILFTMLPLLVFYFFFIFRTKIYWTILAQIPLSTLVRLHAFRLVGIFFIIFWSYNALPTYFAFAAGIGDIFAAVTALLVAKLIDKKNQHYKKITLIWNIVGFWDIVHVIVAALYITKQSIETGSIGVQEMTRFPFCLIPAFAPATIIFLHISIFKKLKMQDKD
jgi:hypothetical protein